MAKRQSRTFNAKTGKTTTKMEEEQPAYTEPKAFSFEKIASVMQAKGLIASDAELKED